MKTLGILLAFLKRDFLVETSYRTAFLLQFFGILMSVLIWRFVSGVLKAPADTPGLDGMDYFAYVLLGLAFFHYLSSALGSFSQKIRQEQMTGTLEAILVTPTSPGTVVLGSALWEFVLSSVKVAIYLVIGWAFGIAIRFENLPLCLLVLAITVLAFSGIGILSAAFVFYLKRGDPITYLVSSVSVLLGGVFYPPQDMWPWLGSLSKFLPITYALHAWRQALLKGATFQEILPDIAALLVFVVILVPLGAIAFRFAIRRARAEGSLVQY
ncbi:MAG TPA: ABC transporter permease [Verrucomicrobiae bacterium]|nr:ABC transporter permease [Verrucomicrobiae bacterium]